MIDSHDYRLTLSGTGVKTGRFSAGDGRLPPLEVASPPEFGGPPTTWSPEDLFVAAISACLMTTFRAMADLSQLEVLAYADEASGRLARDEAGGYRMESVTLRPRVLIGDRDKVAKAHRLLEKAEKACLISRSVSAEVRMSASVDVPEVAHTVPSLSGP